MKKLVKKTVSMILALAMVLVLIPAPSMAKDNSYDLGEITIGTDYTLEQADGTVIDFYFILQADGVQRYKLWLSGMKKDWEETYAPYTVTCTNEDDFERIDTDSYGNGHPIVWVKGSKGSQVHLRVTAKGSSQRIRLVPIKNVSKVEITKVPVNVISSIAAGDNKLKGIAFRLTYQDGTTRDFTYTGELMQFTDDGLIYGIGMTGKDGKDIYLYAHPGGDCDCPMHMLTWQTLKGSSSITKYYGNKAFSLGITSSGDGKLRYKSSNTAVATVSSAGLVTIKGVGTAKIEVYATGTDNYLQSTVKKVTITVKKGTQKISAKVSSKTYKAADLKKGSKYFSIGANTSGTGKLTYKSSNTTRVTVSSTGKVTVKKGTPKGTYKITVTAASNTKYNKAVKTIKVIVK